MEIPVSNKGPTTSVEILTDLRDEANRLENLRDYGFMGVDESAATCPHGDPTCLCATRDLFCRGAFTLHSGATSTFLINCEALTDEALAALADHAATLLPPFRVAVGIPRGGLRFAAALDPYASGKGPLLLVDDVLTTGGSMEEARDDFAEESIGVVIFARGSCPDWITPLFTMGGQS